jgi:uncharacterized protein YeaO (DUF488 family)
MGAGAIPVDIHKAFRERGKKKHALKVYTADYGYSGEDRYDVSFQGGHFMFAPTKKLLLDFRLNRISARDFQEQYFDQLEASFIQHQYTWDEMLELERIVLVCSCNGEGTVCHRHVLIEFLKQFGAHYQGKLKAQTRKPGRNRQE